MSQITNLQGTGGPIAGGIETIEGNHGGPIAGDGGIPNNITIIGTGTIDVTGNPLTNTLTISNTGAASIYPTDNGSALPDPILGNLNIDGGTNINTDALVANTVTVNLNDNVTLAGQLSAAGNIQSTAGNITTTIGNIVSGGELESTGNTLVGNDLIVVNATTLFGPVDVSSTVTINTLGVPLKLMQQGPGVMVVTPAPAHDVQVPNATAANQLLFGTPAQTPQWGTLSAGAGISVVANPAPYGLTIASTAVPLSFIGNNGGVGTINVGNNITFLGAANQIEVTSPSTGPINGQLTVAMTPSIVIANNITSTLGNIVATQGNIQSTLGNIVATQGNVVLTQGNIVLTNGRILLGIDPGAVGQVLTSSGPAATPTWQTSTNSGASVSSFFARQNVDTGYITGDSSGLFYYLGTSSAMSLAPADCFNIGTDFTVGDGVGTPAEYVAPITGSYFFNFQTYLYYRYAGGAELTISMAINNTTAGIIYETANYARFSLISGVYKATIQYYTYIHLTAGDIVTFGIKNTTTSVLSSIGIVGTQSWISGHKVA